MLLSRGYPKSIPNRCKTGQPAQSSVRPLRRYCSRTTEGNCSEFPNYIRSHIGSNSLEGGGENAWNFFWEKCDEKRREHAAQD